MTQLVTITCEDDFELFLYQLKSIEKYVEPCTVNVVINEPDIELFKNKVPASQKHTIKVWSQKEILERPAPHFNGWVTQQLLKLLIPIEDDYICLDAKDIFLRPTLLVDLKKTPRLRQPDPRTGQPWCRFYTPMIRMLYKYYKIRVNSKNVYGIQTPRYIKHAVVKDIPKVWRSKSKFVKWWGQFGMPSEFILYDCMEMCVGLREKASNKFPKDDIVAFWKLEDLNLDTITSATRIVKIHRRIYNDPTVQPKIKSWLDKQLKM
jgi:hypothetical protein